MRRNERHVLGPFASGHVERPWTSRVLLSVVALGLLAPALIFGVDVRAQTAGAVGLTVDATKLGPQVGDRVPDFSLIDQHGQRRTLASLMGPNGLVLAFNRSADW